MPFYHTAQVCKNGHMVNDRADTNPVHNKRFCSKCGAETITACPTCNAKIQGEYEMEGFYYPTTPTVDAFCYNCGKPYPWTQAAILAAAGIIYEEENIPDDLKNRTVETLADVIVETPQTVLATTRLKKCVLTAGKFTVDAIRQFVIDFGCELAKSTFLS